MSKPLRKKDLQDELRRRGITFRVADTIATLQQMLDGSSVASTSTGSATDAPPPASKPPSKKKALRDALTQQGIAFSPGDTIATLQQLLDASRVASTSTPSKPPSRKDVLRAQLSLLDIPFGPRDNVDQLLALCELHNVPGYEPEYETKTKTVVVKCALRKVTNLDDDAFECFRNKIDGLVSIISRMYRRTSIAMYHHFVRLLEKNQHIPDLANQNSTYWKRWLTIGMPGKEFPESVAIKECRISIDPTTDGTVQLGIRVVDVSDRDLIRAHYDEIKDRVGYVIDPNGGSVQAKIRVTHDNTVSLSFDNVGDVLDPTNNGVVYARELPAAYFDQVLAYAGTTLETMVCNNAFVPFMPRLTRLSKNMLVFLKNKGLRTNLTNYKVMNAIRTGETTGFPSKVMEWVDVVRSRLGAAKGVRVHDDYAKDCLGFVNAVRFNAWMQSQFVRLGVRRLKLMPIFSVQRAHVRLDTKTLNLLLAGTEIQREDGTSAAERLKQMKSESNKDIRNGGFGFKDPDKIKEWFPSTKPEYKRKKDFDDVEDWKKHQQAVLEYNAKVAALKSSAKYIEQKQRYDAFASAGKEAAASLFRAIPRKKAPWVFDSSVMTDGVSISLQYSRVVRVRKRKGQKKKGAVTDSVERSSSSSYAAQKTNDWDKDLPTNTDDILVCGIDPGRSNLATVSYLHKCKDERDVEQRKKGNYKLTRGRYRTESGIREEDKLKAQRWKGMKAGWDSLKDNGAALRASDSSNISAYLDAYKDISEDWWGLALKRRESRSNFQRYIGKRKVLDSFFADIDKKLNQEFPELRIEAAYGHAVIGMKSTGPGEVAVPTAQTFAACKRIFKDRLRIVDENFSTKVSWETGKVKELAYLVPRQDGAETVWDMAHTRKKMAPLARKKDVEAVQKWHEKRRVVEKRRKGALVATEADDGAALPSHVDEGMMVGTLKKIRPLRYPEIRGLRFCPERRMYFDRDQSASLTIARLRTQELIGGLRPAPFCF